MMTAVQPWSGYYETADSSMAVVWATAHVTQFTKAYSEKNKWYYLDIGSGSGELQRGGYYTSFVEIDDLHHLSRSISL